MNVIHHWPHGETSRPCRSVCCMGSTRRSGTATAPRCWPSCSASVTAVSDMPSMNSSTSERRSREIKPLDLCQKELHRLFMLCDGQLFWKVKRRSVSPGDLAGALQSNGYWRIGINGRSYKRSRLVWLYVHGVDSYPRFIDHINRDRSDDRIENLRLATHAENQRNRSWGISRCRYVYLDGNRWRARVSTDHGRMSLGRFSSEEEAIAAVQNWELAIG